MRNRVNMTTTNPIHDESSPSDAYMQSIALNTTYNENNIIIDDNKLIKSNYGRKTITTSALLLIIGLVLFITGAVQYWSNKERSGFDLLIVGSILLIPGIYSAIVILGVNYKWRGYSYNQLPSLD